MRRGGEKGRGEIPGAYKYSAVNERLTFPVLRGQIEIDRSKSECARARALDEQVSNSRREVVETFNPALFNRLLVGCRCRYHRCSL